LAGKAGAYKARQVTVYFGGMQSAEPRDS
jgi:hypothetical protein